MTLKEEVLQILRLLALRVKFFWITPWRYPLDTLGFYIFTLMLFSGLILGVTRFAPIQEIEEAKGAVLISYVFWLFYVMSAHSTSISIASLASSGTLERHLITSMGHLKVVLIWLIARYIAYVPQYIVIIVILTLIFRVQIFFSFGIVIAVVAVFLVSFLFFIGLALIFTGLALVFKQVTSVIGLFQFIFFTFSLAANDPSGSWLDQVFQWFPYTQAIKILIKITTNAEGWSSAFTPSQFGPLLGGSLFFLLVGFGVFRKMDQIAIQKGLLGQY